MRSVLQSRLTVVWMLLLIATLISREIPYLAGGANASLPGVAILLIAALKVRFVIFDFMEIRTAPRFMRRVADGWLVVVWAAMIALYLGAAHGI